MNHLIAGNDPDNLPREVAVDRNGGVLLSTIGKDGEPEQVTQGFGLGIRQHDDVMLSYGYSRFSRHEVSVPTGDFLVLRLDTNDVNQHHAEVRLVGTSSSSIRLKTYVATGNEGLFPSGPVQLPVFNQLGIVKETVGVDVLAELSAYPIQQSDPFSALTPADNAPLFIASGGGPIDPTPDNFPNIKGRHYLPNNSYALVIENIGSEATTIYYQYDWHEF